MRAFSQSGVRIFPKQATLSNNFFNKKKLSALNPLPNKRICGTASVGTTRTNYSKNISSTIYVKSGKKSIHNDDDVIMKRIADNATYTSSFQFRTIDADIFSR